VHSALLASGQGLISFFLIVAIAGIAALIFLILAVAFKFSKQSEMKHGARVCAFLSVFCLLAAVALIYLAQALRLP
jgi:hypothetical protein